MKGVIVIKRRVLVTVVVDQTSGIKSEIYGRYDAVALKNKGLIIESSNFRRYEMCDADFVKYGKEIK
jgi:hypothetical protein